MKASMMRYQGDNLTETLWDKMQYKLGCCGVLSIDDWQNISWTDDMNCTAPASCRIRNTELTRLVPIVNVTTIDAYNVTNIPEECLADLATPHHSEVR